MAPEAGRRHILVLGDQLSSTLGPIAGADPDSTSVLLVESAAWARRRRYHRAKLVLVTSAMRHFAAELRERGFRVSYQRVGAFEDGLRAYLTTHAGARLELMDPADHGLAERLEAAVGGLGGTLDLVPNVLWLSDTRAFDTWADGRRVLRLDHWYREERRRTGWLMSADGQPEGGRWSLDADNRRRVPAGKLFPAPPAFPPDELTAAVIEEVTRDHPDLPGELAAFSWPVTRADALRMLHDFIEHRLREFGPYQDAMVDGQPVLAHSLLSVPLNLGLINAQEACEAALAAHADEARRADPDRAIPLSSVEGFIRQMLGWREFMRHAYRRGMPHLAVANALGHTGSLPGFYWTGETAMRCLGEAVRGVLRTGHAHHIQRLMVLGNWALLAGVDPREVDAWFLELFVDAFDWVVVPNVMGMSQWADQGFTSKPYISGGRYIERMGDHCARCPYDPAQASGPRACPFSSLYWDFVDRHAERLVANARTGNAARAWQRRDAADRSAILERAREVRDLAAKGDL